VEDQVTDRGEIIAGKLGVSADKGAAIAEALDLGTDPDLIDRIIAEKLAETGGLGEDPRTVPELDGPDPWHAWCIGCGWRHATRQPCHRCWCIRCAKRGRRREPLTERDLYHETTGGFCLECWAETLCTVCGAKPRVAHGRCNTCAQYFRRNGRERPRRLWERQPTLNLNRVIRAEAEAQRTDPNYYYVDRWGEVQSRSGYGYRQGELIHRFAVPDDD
jgi:hypothetical protein